MSHGTFTDAMCPSAPACSRRTPWTGSTPHPGSPASVPVPALLGCSPRLAPTARRSRWRRCAATPTPRGPSPSVEVLGASPGLDVVLIAGSKSSALIGVSISPASSERSARTSQEDWFSWMRPPRTLGGMVAQRHGGGISQRFRGPPDARRGPVPGAAHHSRLAEPYNDGCAMLEPSPLRPGPLPLGVPTDSTYAACP